MLNNRRLATITKLDGGSHEPDHTYCLMEAVAYVAGEDWTDHPECACPVLAAYGRTLNDNMTDDQRQKLIPLIPLLVNSRADRSVERRRAYFLVDQAVRVFAPTALRCGGMEQQAVTLERLTPITNQQTAKAAANAANIAYAANPATNATACAACAADAACAAYAADAAYAAARAAACAANATTFADEEASIWDRAIEVLKEAINIKEEEC